MDFADVRDGASCAVIKPFKAASLPVVTGNLSAQAGELLSVALEVAAELAALPSTPFTTSSTNLVPLTEEPFADSAYWEETCVKESHVLAVERLDKVTYTTLPSIIFTLSPSTSSLSFVSTTAASHSAGREEDRTVPRSMLPCSLIGGVNDGIVSKAGSSAAFGTGSFGFDGGTRIDSRAGDWAASERSFNGAKLDIASSEKGSNGPILNADSLPLRHRAVEAVDSAALAGIPATAAAEYCAEYLPESGKLDMFSLGNAVLEILNIVHPTAVVQTALPAALELKVLLEQSWLEDMCMTLQTLIWTILCFGMHAMYNSALHVFDIRKLGMT